MICRMHPQVLVTLPFNLVSSLCFSGVFYGMSGLNPGAPQFARFSCVISLFFLISHQVRCKYSMCTTLPHPEGLGSPQPSCCHSVCG